MKFITKGLWTNDFLLRCFVLLLLAVGAGSQGNGNAMADYPGIPRTIELGPGNDDVAAILERNVVDSILPIDGRASQSLDLSNRDLRHARIHLRLDSLRNVNFDGADLTGASIQETAFTKCSFRGAKLRRIDASVFLNSDCDLTGADISGSNIYLTAPQLRSTKNYQERNLSFTTITGNYTRVSFAGFDLRGTMFYRCQLTGCDFTDADIRGCTIVARYEADEHRPIIPFSIDLIYSTRSYREGDLAEVMFRGCDLKDADFSGQSLGIFWYCDLRGADLTNVSFFPARGSSSNFPQSSNRQCGFIQCELSAEQFYATRAYQSGRFPQNFILHDMDLDGWDLSNLDLRGVSFDRSSLKGVNLAGARGGDFQRAKDMTVEQVKSMWNYQNGRLAEYHWPQFLLSKDILDSLNAEKEVANE